MIIRPVDENGDILPVLTSASLLESVSAIARLIKDRLELLAGEWWENPAWGNEVLEMMRSSRLTEADSQALANYITSYIRQTSGVLEVEDVVSIIEGRQFNYSCKADTEDGPVEINYNV
jgi:hypothetical protein